MIIRKGNLMRQLISLSIVLAVTGCTWVDLTESGDKVEVGYAGNIQQCEHLGVVSARTQSKMLLERDEATVQDELHTLARNNAATLGATNIVLHGLPKDGVQAFAAYRCPNV
jgi:hypothetical protein